MPLQFQPYSLEPYMMKIQSEQQNAAAFPNAVAGGITNALSAFVAEKEKAKQEAWQKQLQSMMMQKFPYELAKLQQETDPIDMSGFPFRGQSPMVQQNPLSAVAPSTSPLIPAFNKWNQMRQLSGQAKPAMNSSMNMDSIPAQSQQPQANQGMGNISPTRLKMFSEVADFKKKMNELQNPKNLLNVDQFRALQSGDPDKMNAAFPNGIPADLVKSTVAGEQKLSGENRKQIDTDWKEVRKIANPYRSTGMGGASSVFNRAAIGNQAAARGLKVLDKPSLTWGELNAYVNSDVASIQRGGGVPTDVQLHEANYNTLLGQIGMLQTYVTGKPATGLVPPETRAQMRENIMEIIKVDNQIIDDGVSYVQTSYPEAINAHKGTWDAMIKEVNKIKTVGQGGGINSNGQSQIPTISTQQQYDALPSGSEYLDSTGMRARKR